MMKTQQKGPRVLLVDIETAPILMFLWDIWNAPGNWGLDRIEKDWHIMSFAAKWLGEKKIFYFDQSKAKNLENDKPLLRELWKLLDEADWVIAHNGIRFDVPAINTRMILMGLKPYSPIQVIDTQMIAKKTFKFTSMKLQYLSSKLCKVKKSIHKRFPGFLLWKETMLGNKWAWSEMKSYNIDDVLSLEELYIEFRPWFRNHPKWTLFTEPKAGRPDCSKCGGSNLEKYGQRRLVSGLKQRYRCQDCGGFSEGVIERYKSK